MPRIWCKPPGSRATSELLDEASLRLPTVQQAVPVLDCDGNPTSEWKHDGKVVNRRWLIGKQSWHVCQCNSYEVLTSSEGDWAVDGLMASPDAKL